MPLFEGFLCKQGSGRGLFEFKTWKVRFCVVDWHCIKFYSSTSELSELRNYSLRGASVSSNVDAAEYEAPFESVFMIHFSPESQTMGSPANVVLCVESLEEMQSWIDAIKSADASTQISKITIDEPWTWLSSQEIQSLSTMLSFDSFSPIFAFARTLSASELGPFCDHTSIILLHSCTLLRFVDICIDQLMSGQVLSTLFRENTTDLRFIARYLFLVGKDYLKKVVEPHIIITLQHPSLEVDPFRNPIQDPAMYLSDQEKSAIQEAQCKSNHAKIMTITSSLLKSIDGAELPRAMVKVLQRIAASVSREFPTFLNAGVCNVFFLRFIVASLCNPHFFGLCKDVELSSLQSRNLSIIAKVVQNIANGIIENKKEPYMQPLSSFVAEQQIFMVKFLSKVMQAGSLLTSENDATSLQCFASTISMQDLIFSSNWWIQLIHKHSSELPSELQNSISQYEFDSSLMRDSIRGQLANWSLIMDGKLVTHKPVLISSLKPAMFCGDAFIVARFNCWCKLNRAMMHGTLYVTRSAFIFNACCFDSFHEIFVMQFTTIERITKVDIESLVHLDMNRKMFLDLPSAIRIDFTAEFSSAPAIIFGITVDSGIAVPVDGSIDAAGKKSPSVFAAMYSLLSLSKTRQEAEGKSKTRQEGEVESKEASKERAQGSSSSEHLRDRPKSSSLARSSSVKFSLPPRNSSLAVPILPRLVLLQEIVKAIPDEASANRLSSTERTRRGSIRAHAQCLMHHIGIHKNCYETNFSALRVATRDPPILTRADWDALSPFVCVMVLNAGEYAEFPDSSQRYLLNVNSGSFAYCSGRKKNVEFFITRGNNLTYETSTATHDFAQLYACEPRSSLIFLPIPLEAIPNAPEGLENRMFQFTLSVVSSSFREMKSIERSLTSALQHHGSTANTDLSTDDASKTVTDVAPSDHATQDSSSAKSGQIQSSLERERMLQAILHSRRSKHLLRAASDQFEHASDVFDEDSD